jgi:pimeloyl-ACP methyl ester carboxylesterase
LLAGHSFGGLYVLRFAAMYPDQVAGMVLLDSTAPKPGPVPPANGGSDSALRRAALLFSAVADLGVGGLSAQSSYGTQPPHSGGEGRANASNAPTSLASSRSLPSSELVDDAA